jgi:hypothetical protein
MDDAELDLAYPRVPIAISLVFLLELVIVDLVRFQLQIPIGRVTSHWRCLHGLNWP